MIRTSGPLCLVLLVSTMAYAAVADSDTDPLDAGMSQRRQLQAAAAYPDVLSLMRSRPDLTAATALVQHFPYIVLGLLNPAFEGTIFLPTDAALGKYLNFTSTPALIRSFFNNMDPRLNVLGGIRESLFKRTYWATMTNHIVLSKLYTAADLSKGLYMPSALPDITLTSQAVNGKVVIFGPQSNATVQVADIKAGKAIVHIIDYVLVYRPEGMDDFPLLSTEGADNAMFISIMKKSTLWTALNSAPPPNGPYTVFTPNDAAVTKYLAAKKTTLAKLLANPKACDAIAKAHVIQGTAFWLWDLMAVAVLGPTPPESPTFLNGSPVVALLSPTATRVFIKSGKVTAEVTAPVDLGGNTFGCTRLVDGDCAGDYTSVFHILDAVLPSA